MVLILENSIVLPLADTQTPQTSDVDAAIPLDGPLIWSLGRPIKHHYKALAEQGPYFRSIKRKSGPILGAHCQRELQVISSEEGSLWKGYIRPIKGWSRRADVSPPLGNSPPVLALGIANSLN